MYELKFDGCLVAGVKDGEVRLNTRSGADATKWFPEIVEGLSKLSGGPHVLDGEVCVLDDLGRSDFNRLQDRARRKRLYEGPWIGSSARCRVLFLLKGPAGLFSFSAEAWRRLGPMQVGVLRSSAGTACFESSPA